MIARLAPYDSAMAAGKILAAMQAGNLAGLESELQYRWEPPADIPADSAERWELLNAVTCQMRDTLDRIRRRSIDCFEGVEVHVGLLQHLAGHAAAM